MPFDPPLARRDLIAARLDAGRSVSAADLACEFAVSEDAIRRDLRALAAAGRCRRVYGGALPMSGAPLPLSARIAGVGDDQRRLARAAVATVRPGELVFLDSGSTNYALVDLLPEDAGLTVATNAVEIAAAVLRRQDLPLLVIGGGADPVVGGCVDAAAVDAVSRMRIDRSFIGACGVSAAGGLGARVFADAGFKRALLSASRRALALATADKIGDDAPFHISPLDRLEALVVDAGLDPSRRRDLEGAGARLLLAADPA